MQQGRVALAYPTVLARFGISQVRDHRRVGAKLNIKDVMSRYCQAKKHVVVERLDQFDEEENAWQEAVVEDTRTATVPDIVSFRVDFADWLSSLKRRDRRIAEFLALGNRTSEAARKFGVSEGRVSPASPRACGELAPLCRRAACNGGGIGDGFVGQRGRTANCLSGFRLSILSISTGMM